MATEETIELKLQVENLKTKLEQMEYETTIINHLKLLGLKVRDKVTNFEGVVISIGFDLFGCIQALVKPVVNDNYKMEDPCWLVVTRLIIVSESPVMKVPNYSDIDYVNIDKKIIRKGEKGPALKPAIY